MLTVFTNSRKAPPAYDGRKTKATSDDLRVGRCMARAEKDTVRWMRAHNPRSGLIAKSGLNRLLRKPYLPVRSRTTTDKCAIADSVIRSWERDTRSGLALKRLSSMWYRSVLTTPLFPKDLLTYPSAIFDSENTLWKTRSQDW